ncbi:MAG: hypothetical protein RQ757_04340 [Pseudomonadales bacterium]|nr:hypothetical protein [Pseudomonadales bacterium]
MLNSREKKLLLISAVIALVFLAGRGLPLVQDWYAERGQVIEQIAMDVAREQQLLADAELWSQRRQEIEARAQAMSSQVFQETTVPLLSASIQRLVREHASASDINISGASLAESLATEGWLLVQQEMSFSMSDQSNTLAFLERLENSQPYLAVSEFTMRRVRNQYTGSLTVVGFSRSGSAAPVLEARR